MITKSCLICEKEFKIYPYQLNKAKFCSEKCSRKNPFFRSDTFRKLMKNVNKSYSHKFIKNRKPWNKGIKWEAMSGENHPLWKGGIYHDKDGYKSILVKDHPNANKYGYVLEHRLVVEKYLGRYLEKNEVVHHINHNRLDNRPENLYVFLNQFSHWKFHSQERELKSNII